MRHVSPLINPDHVDCPVVVLAQHYRVVDGHWHSHRKAQLIHASEGFLSVHSEHGMWLVPPLRGVWIPGDVLHKVASKSDFWLNTVYVDRTQVACPSECCVVAVDTLTSALLVEAAKADDGVLSASAQRLLQVLSDRLGTLPTLPFNLPRPTDARLVRITQRLEANPALPHTLQQLTANAGLSLRTAARLFQRETGMSFGKWRQQLRLLKALEPLSVGHAVSRVASDVGYEDTSSFITAFKNAFGETPAKWRPVGRTQN